MAFAPLLAAAPALASSAGAVGAAGGLAGAAGSVTALSSLVGGTTASLSAGLAGLGASGGLLASIGGLSGLASLGSIAMGGVGALQAIGQASYESKMYEMRSKEYEVDAIVKRSEYKAQALANYQEMNEVQGLIAAGPGLFADAKLSRFNEAGRVGRFNINTSLNSGNLSYSRNMSSSIGAKMQASAARSKGVGNAFGSVIGGAVDAVGIHYSNKEHQARMRYLYG